MTILILFGPPGSGKGTQASKLVEAYDFVHISTGDLFRYEMKNDTELGQKAKEYMSKGQLVPDEITVGMLKNKLDKHPEAKGVILDGFPRTIAQSEALDHLLQANDEEVACLIALTVDDEEIVKRIKSRGETSGRADDLDESIIRNRINVYKNETTPVFDYYDNKDKAEKVEGVGSIDDIFNNLCEVVDRYL